MTAIYCKLITDPDTHMCEIHTQSKSGVTGTVETGKGWGVEEQTGQGEDTVRVPYTSTGHIETA